MVMSDCWILNQPNLIKFVLIDASGNEVTGLGSGFTLEISKGNGGAFAGSAGTKSEISNGWYQYLTTAGEADTPGDVAIKVTHASIVQQNLVYCCGSYTNGTPRTYTVTNSVTALPIEGATVWITTDITGNNIIWSGVTDALGVARNNGQLPVLVAGTYYFWKKIAGYVDDDNPDTEVFS